jgi:hypothetical protein
MEVVTEEIESRSRDVDDRLPQVCALFDRLADDAQLERTWRQPNVLRDRQQRAPDEDDGRENCRSPRQSKGPANLRRPLGYRMSRRFSEIGRYRRARRGIEFHGVACGRRELIHAFRADDKK